MALLPITSAPGVKRDGTLFDNDAHNDAVWCRWHNGRAKKIGGFKELNRGFPEIGRGMRVDTLNDFTYVHVGSPSFLRRTAVQLQTGVTTGVIDRTPSGFDVDSNNLWQFDSEFDVGTSLNYILAHAAPNAANIASDTATPVYYGDATDVAALTAIALSDVSGGVCVLHPYNVIYGSDGYLAWSAPGLPTDFAGVGSGAARPTASKIVKGLPLRAGPGSSPAGLFWSLDTLSRLMFVGGTSIFSFDTISTASSVLSAAAIIEHNGTYYWPSRGGFLMFNGVLQEVPNAYNQLWFNSNINMDLAQIAYATKVPLYGEIWFCFPTTNSTVCDHAVVLNYRNKFWYDTPLPNGGRSCAAYEQVFSYPMMMGAVANTSNTFSLWQHEFGVNEVSGITPQSLAVKSSFRTKQINVIGGTPQAGGADRELSIQVVEPDFNQTGDLTMRVYGAPNATVKDPPQLSADIPIPEPTDGGQGSIPGVNVSQRLIEFEFESNVADGDFYAGNILAHVEDGGDRRTS
jgi:hypothetical protein